MANSPSKSISFKVGHTLSTKKYARDSKFWDVCVLVKEKFDVDRVEFLRYGSLTALPIHTARTSVSASGSSMLRFYFRGYEEKQSTGEESTIIVRVILSCGRMSEVWHQVDSESNGERINHQHVLMVPRLIWRERLSVPPLSSKLTFGVELELSEGRGSSQSAIAQAIKRRSNEDVRVVDAYRDVHKKVPTWKLVQDGSIVCSRSSPNCSKFELVSPILCGERGLKSCSSVLSALVHSTSTHISVNKSMGFHVHVSVQDFTLEELKKVCLNFVKYEEAMDLIMPPSRRTGSYNSNDYFQSCRANICNASGTIAKQNGGRHKAIMSCRSVKSLCRLMNPSGRYYKLNMQNLVTGRQPTVEFRQHSATASSDKVLAWVRFCVTFVRNSARKSVPEYLKNNMDPEEIFYDLFEDLIQCNVLESFYGERMEALAEAVHSTGSRAACCSGCHRGQSCHN